MEETQTILVVEDEVTLREALVYNLNKEGYTVLQAGTGLDALALARAEAPDVVILDLMLPELDGLSVCRSLRRDPATAASGILMLTARSGELDKIVGLESGADDYLTKPFSLGELLARVRALLRRARSTAPRDTLEAGNLVLDLIARRATRNGVDLPLKPKEFSLLAELMRHRGAVLSRDLLLNHVWGQDFFGDDRTVDVHVRWLREKIEDDPAHPAHIQTVRGLGYRFEA
ncbi:winged helix-turn-helix domain-containing protein [Candidatus Amarolinea aalborgensis]|uniref:winged helix-turn-helix domain-containing protein n=1 Tax=Candidatus Amarolinea aalborgensis TaxID=2249329 RepID=UPI003BF95985